MTDEKSEKELAKSRDPEQTPDQSPHSKYPLGSDAGTRKLPDPDAPVAAQARADREAEEKGSDSK